MIDSSLVGTPTTHPSRPCVLVFAGSDPSGGAGLQADLQAIAAQGAHALTVTTALTVQDNNHVTSINPVSADLIFQQAQALTATIPIAAIKIGVIGTLANAQMIAQIIQKLNESADAPLPVVLDTVLASGAGDTLVASDPVAIFQSLYPLTTLLTPNLLEARRLALPPTATPLHDNTTIAAAAAQYFLQQGCGHVLVKGEHAGLPTITNRLYGADGQQHTWTTARLPGQFHGTGCTLAAAIAAQLALGQTMEDAVTQALDYCHQALLAAYAIAPGQAIPNRQSIQDH